MNYLGYLLVQRRLESIDLVLSNGNPTLKERTELEFQKKQYEKAIKEYEHDRE